MILNLIELLTINQSGVSLLTTNKHEPLTHNNMETFKIKQFGDVMYNGLYRYHEDVPIQKRYDESPFYVGIELETVTSRHIEDEIESNWFYFQRDSSLGDQGAELTTLPLTYQVAKDYNVWSTIVDYLVANNYRSWDNSSCGLHIHISKSIFGSTESEQELNILKMLYMYYGVIDGAYKKRVFKRDTNGYARERPQTKLQACTTIGLGNIQKKALREIGKAELEDKNRYYEINTDGCNGKTIEFRRGKGTLNVNSIIAMVEFCVELCKFSKSKRIKDLRIDLWHSHVMGFKKESPLRNITRQIREA
jgi:hypothetical protein